MADSLGDRQKQYEDNYDYSITRRVPIIIRADGRSFHRVTRKLQKPYCPELLNVMANTMMYAITEMQGAVFGYQQSDEITYVLRNDQSLDAEPWYQNRVQKMVSIAASLTTLGFNKCLQTLDTKLDIVGDAIFDARVFAMPYISEVANNLIWRQQDCSKNAISGAAQAELAAKFGKRTALKLLDKKISSEKKELLLHHCGIDFDDYYPTSFRRGVAVYKIPTIVPTKDGGVSRNKWNLSWDIPNFVEEKDFLMNILINGHDVFRAPSVLTFDDNSEKKID
ncbi:MAG TPA: tRNA(His) guanylyltransferase Thg1 family protein [Anaerovoracaceae bacterium]|nr:tRNA(His) guanylyltransferase Thg1 family protein [Anaerovoracaceae bacterium]